MQPFRAGSSVEKPFSFAVSEALNANRVAALRQVLEEAVPKGLEL